MLKKIFTVFAIFILVFAIVVAMQPSKFRVTRSAMIAAQPAAVFAQVNDLHNWKAWSPWAKLDPNAQESFEGPAWGIGAIMRWSGNKQVGAGSMTITESVPDERVRFKLEFVKPFKGTNTAEFTFTPQGDQTAVTWTMEGHKTFITKAIGLFMNCEKIAGSQFEKGLAQMKAVVEGK